MPELPEVETVVRGLRPILVGRRLARVELHREGLRRPFPEGLVQRLTGATVTGVARRAKFGLIATDRDDTLVLSSRHVGANAARPRPSAASTTMSSLPSTMAMS